MEAQRKNVDERQRELELAEGRAADAREAQRAAEAAYMNDATDAAFAAVEGARASTSRAELDVAAARERLTAAEAELSRAASRSNAERLAYLNERYSIPALRAELAPHVRQFAKARAAMMAAIHAIEATCEAQREHAAEAAALARALGDECTITKAPAQYGTAAIVAGTDATSPIFRKVSLELVRADEVIADSNTSTAREGAVVNLIHTYGVANTRSKGLTDAEACELALDGALAPFLAELRQASSSTRAGSASRPGPGARALFARLRGKPENQPEKRPENQERA